MQVRIITAYICDQNKVVAVAQGESYIFPYRLKQEKNDKLLGAVLTAGRIDTDKWKQI